MPTERDCPLVHFKPGRPLIVLTNDDGVASAGLVALKDALEPLGEVRIVAPDQNRSGAARSITMHAPLWVEEVELPDGAWPSHRRHARGLRAHGGAGSPGPAPDLIVSGINLGGNLGDDITYSGTVAAALEGIMLDIPAIALSADGYHPGYDLTVPARFAHRLVSVVLRRGFPAKTLLNVNCPDRPWAALRGARLTTLGKRIYGDKVQYQDSKGNRRVLPHLQRRSQLPSPGGLGLRGRGRGLRLRNAPALRSHVARGSRPPALLGSDLDLAGGGE